MPRILLMLMLVMRRILLMLRLRLMVRQLLLVVVLTIGLPAPAWADLDDTLEEMFDNWGLTNVSPGGVYQSQQRGYLTGGRHSLRIYNNQFPTFSFAPPQFRFGCSGIDLYLGAFSYGSLSRYTNLLQQLGTGAVVGFAFQLALKELCEPCSDVLNKLESAARMINSASRLNPCEIGKTVGRAVAGDGNSIHRVSERINDTWQQAKELTGVIGDVYEDRDTVRTQTATTAVTDAALSGTADDPRGNLTWMVLKEAGMTDDTARMIMSALGTVVIDRAGRPVVHPPLLTFQELLLSQRGDVVQVYRCVDGVQQTQCLEMAVQRHRELDGFHTRVEERLLDILTKIYAQTGLSTDDADFIALVPVPIYRLLTDTTGPIDNGEELIMKTSRLVAAQMALRWLEWASRQTVAKAYQTESVRRQFAGDVRAWRATAETVVEAARLDVLKEAGVVESLESIVRSALFNAGNTIQRMVPTKE